MAPARRQTARGLAHRECAPMRKRDRRPDPRRVLADDARRAVGYLEAVLADARRLGVEPEEGVGACATVWRAWAERIREEREPPD
jgi:hypothetical protein